MTILQQNTTAKPLTQKQKIARDFSRAAKQYDGYAILQREVLEQMLPLLPESWQQQKVVDAGTGTAALKRMAPECQLIGLDVAWGMCEVSKAHQPTVQADMESLPLATSSVEGCVSSLAIQWLKHPEKFFAEVYRITHPEGWFVFSTLDEGTLAELELAYRKAALPSPLLSFQRSEALLRSLQNAGWKVETQQENQHYTHYNNVISLLKHFRGLGAQQKKMRPSLRHKSDLAKLTNAYPLTKGEVQASWRVLTVRVSK